MGCCIPLISKKGVDKFDKPSLKSIFEYNATSIDGNTIDFTEYKKYKAIYITNVASE